MSTSISSAELEQRFKALKTDIREAGLHVMHMRKMGQAEVRYKADESPVTTADIWANTFLREAIEKRFPAEPVVGEEDEVKSYPAGSGLVWYLDPIDGTNSFVKGGKDYYLLAGLVYEGQPVLGMHYRPETDTMLYGWKGFGAGLEKNQRNPERLYPKLTEWGPASRIFIKSYAEEIRERVKKLGVTRAKYLPGMVDMVGPLFGMSEGFVSYRRTAFWDLAAPAAIMASAGFRHSSEGFNGESPQLFNNGGWHTPFYYSLPPNTPDSFIQGLFDIDAAFSER
ncbi:MAG: hypothetical protein LAT75_07135 [Candidatus Cyclonatronum sp.]|uniref:3'(2'),5'-bisphosphate nucleotidase CysQ family protein n=1 Tax=Cyclonatronum sp. TaxID=3024185 RepID=UPI0025C17F07|nr:inositol monophosphatase family protein [Cyclonatronum sp.]MCH8486622.1 hypothetical protein [Cyclonatronum sp.]